WLGHRAKAIARSVNPADRSGRNPCERFVECRSRRGSRPCARLDVRSGHRIGPRATHRTDPRTRPAPLKPLQEVTVRKVLPLVLVAAALIPIGAMRAAAQRPTDSRHVTVPGED